VSPKTRLILSIAFVLVVWSVGESSGQSAPDIATAIRNNDVQTLRRLVSAQNVNVPIDRGRTPLMLAANTGTVEAMQALISAGADVNASDNVGITPLMFSVRDNAKVRLLLTAGARVNEKSRQSQTALLIAAANSGAIETVRLLVEKGADAKAVGASGRTGLILAAGANDLEMVRFFLEQGVNVNAVNTTDISGHTALMAAAAQNNTAAVRLLIDKGANVNMAATDAATVKNGPLAFKGRTALMMAASYGSPELIGLLLNAKAEVNAKDVAGLTPLMFAVASENQDPEIVKLMLSAGADPSARSTAGETALDWAHKYGSPEILKLLKDEAGRPAATSVVKTLPSESEIRSMIRVSTSLLQQSSIGAATNGGCVNCHHQNFTGMAIAAARNKGIGVDEPAAASMRQSMIVSLSGRENSFVQRIDSGGGLDSALNTMAALQADKYPANAVTDSMVAYLLSRQFADGRWPREETSRAPIQDGDINRAAVAVSLIRAFAPPSLEKESNEHIARTRQWLLRIQPKSTDDKAMLLAGLRQAGAPDSRIQAAGKVLLEAQRSDGGWGGNPNLESDAYATSEALLALLDSGIVKTSNAVYQNGLRYLLSTRAVDGSWHVRSRAPKFQPYFESGFPYGHDQWISVAATARAVMVLCKSLP